MAIKNGIIKSRKNTSFSLLKLIVRFDNFKLDKNVIKIKPPLTFSIENSDYLISCLDTVFSEDYMNLNH